VPKQQEIDQHNLHMEFSAISVDFSSPSPNPLGSKQTCARVRQREMPL